MENKKTLPMQRIRYENLGQHTFYMKWEGYITPDLIRRSMIPELFEARTIIFDVSKRCYLRFNLSEFKTQHPPLPNLEKVLIVSDASTREWTASLMEFLQNHHFIEIGYFCSRAEAEAFL